MKPLVLLILALASSTLAACDNPTPTAVNLATTPVASGADEPEQRVLIACMPKGSEAAGPYTAATLQAAKEADDWANARFTYRMRSVKLDIRLKQPYTPSEWMEIKNFIDTERAWNVHHAPTHCKQTAYYMKLDRFMVRFEPRFWI